MIVAANISSALKTLQKVIKDEQLGMVMNFNPL